MRNDYSANDPKGWGGDPSRGAALGRAAIRDEPKDWAGKLSLRRAYLDRGGYDSNGTYFGVGRPLYWCSNEDLTVDYMLRADSRADARSQVLKAYPAARVRR